MAHNVILYRGPRHGMSFQVSDLTMLRLKIPVFAKAENRAPERLAENRALAFLVYRRTPHRVGDCRVFEYERTAMVPVRKRMCAHARGDAVL